MTLFLYDYSTNLLHLPESGCSDELHNLRSIGTVKTCISKGYKPCPKCCSKEWKQTLRAYNEEVVQKRRCGYFFFENSKVFHRGTCNVILSATRDYSSAMYFDTCIEKGRVPCKICKPVRGLFADASSHEEEIGQWMKKHERRALNRYAQARKERSAVDQKNLTDLERKDMLTLTATNYGFWAAVGYKSFHLRGCKKLNRLTNLKGFETFQQAIHAGYQPCRMCKPSKKHDMRISMPICTKEKKDERVADILMECMRLGLKYQYKEPILHLCTGVAEWEINVTMRPVVIEHKPLGCNTFHQQHKMFMSIADAIAYIVKHDKQEYWR